MEKFKVLNNTNNSRFGIGQISGALFFKMKDNKWVCLVGNSTALVGLIIQDEKYITVLPSDTKIEITV